MMGIKNAVFFDNVGCRQVSRRRREQRLEGRQQLFRARAWRRRQRGGKSLFKRLITHCQKSEFDAKA
jgi:hypothetical protein